jgi:hypothetical protein
LVEDPTTLFVPERKGNRLIFSLQNILDNPQVAMIFLVPGTEETLRVQGRAELTADPQMCDRFTARGRPALLVTRVKVERCYFHCAKAFKRSRLWDPTPGRHARGSPSASRPKTVMALTTRPPSRSTRPSRKTTARTCRRARPQARREGTDPSV